MIFTDRDLHIWAGKGGVRPYTPQNLNPASLDLTLSQFFIDMEQQETGLFTFEQLTLYPRSLRTELHNTIAARLFSKPKRFVAVLASTIESLSIPNDVAGEVKLKTTPCRNGLAYPIADWVDPGFDGQITLILSATRPIILTAGMRICQIVLYRLPRLVAKGYAQRSGHYMNQYGPTRAWEE